MAPPREPIDYSKYADHELIAEALKYEGVATQGLDAQRIAYQLALRLLAESDDQPKEPNE